VSLTSKVGIAKTGTTSLRATIPEGIVAFLDLKAGEKLEWKMKTMNDERVVIVSKVKSNDVMRIALKYAKPKQE
jgi:bifunctional DNA-binding transcriptional regulator/antitoxin component of YhaV-PrlF toxin-antitoxin module